MSNVLHQVDTTRNCDVAFHSEPKITTRFNQPHGYKSSSEEYAISPFFYECLRELIRLNVHIWTSKFLLNRDESVDDTLDLVADELEHAFNEDDDWKLVKRIISMEEQLLKNGVVLDGSRLGQRPGKFTGIKPTTLLCNFQSGRDGVIKLLRHVCLRNGQHISSEQQKFALRIDPQIIDELERQYRAKSFNFYYFPAQCSLIEYMVHAVKRRSTLFEPNDTLTSRTGLASLTLKLQVVLGLHSALIPLSWLDKMLGNWSQIKGINYKHNLNPAHVRSKAVNLARNELSLNQTITSKQKNLNSEEFDFFGMSDEQLHKLTKEKNSQQHSGNLVSSVNNNNMMEDEGQADLLSEQKMSVPSALTEESELKTLHEMDFKSLCAPTRLFGLSPTTYAERKKHSSKKSQTDELIERLAFVEKENRLLHTKISALQRENQHLEATFQYFGAERKEMSTSFEHMRMEIKTLQNALRVSMNERRTQKKVDLSAFSEQDLSELQKRIFEEREERLRCAVCMDRRANVVLIPCQHQKTCKECTAQMEECPLCRMKITSKIVPYR